MADHDGLPGKGGRIPEQGASGLSAAALGTVLAPARPDLIAACARETVTLGFHDDSWTGWVLTAGYALGAVLALAMTMTRPSGRHGGRERAFWALLALAMVALGVNKQLDLQTAMTDIARCVAIAEGWYDRRGPLQLVAVAALAVGAAIGAVLVLVWLRPVLRRTWVPALGLVVLIAFIVLRAMSFHHLDGLLGTDMLSTRLHRLIELAALALIVLGTLAALLRRPRPGPRGHGGAG